MAAPNNELPLPDSLSTSQQSTSRLQASKPQARSPSPSQSPTPTQLHPSRPLVSPRLQHVAGEIPPALSPLDAFAAQGRLLAKQFDESRKAGRRLSRLPPASVERSLSQPRGGYHRTLSDEDTRQAQTPMRAGFNFEQRGRGRGEAERAPFSNGMSLEEPSFRPKSQHPRISGLPLNTSTGNTFPIDDSWDTRSVGNSAYGIPRANSPDTFWNRDGSRERGRTPSPGPGPTIDNRLHVVRSHSPQPGGSPTRFYATQQQQRSNSNNSGQQHNHLAPPPLLPSYSSPAGSTQESSDDDGSSAKSTFSLPRKMSSSSGISMLHSPQPSQMSRAYQRSPSPNSEAGTGGSMTPNLTKPSFNFSRPMSRSNTSHSVHDSATSSPATGNTATANSFLNRENKPAPITVPAPLATPSPSADEATEPPLSAGQSYIYAKFSLPRGRLISRDSKTFNGGELQGEFQPPQFERSITDPGSTQDQTQTQTQSQTETQTQTQIRTETPTPIQNPNTTSPAKSIKRVRPSLEQEQSSTSIASANAETKSVSVQSQSTVRATPAEEKEKDKDAENEPTTAEEHVTRGIECHESGSLKESTYHLRLAAMQNHPTGMLLYALACRHGWGRRADQTEGVQWLRRAVDTAGLDLASSNPPSPETCDAALQKLLSSSGSGKMNMSEQKARQAQLALAIYELGVSNLNGWGVGQDKALALRCFEIAGRWGDVDAMAEAGYCYAEGVGCKKDLKKAAKYYRMAEKEGMSMVGSSWIYKDKYMDDDAVSKKKGGGSVKSTSSKSRTRSRSIFGRKKPSDD
ncbi:cell cycle inhibitor Nif1, putative [Trichophyton verrucosum HKI 0517]|uniref:Cell cycle inhibitor Nif1, putative n=1 Tax=Trichophyton verrucosum (strain HKI 0517) TaxID=663202 RepID=D4DDI8_TRIVH|nr:cell cycle inhibitor Nif1, putative [Trichophyton verrucosum HKI 0517]EFE40055.1 cell cycle inhibitor Nif1, putative [Trichophyton verrucosum HKI 0517]